MSGRQRLFWGLALAGALAVSGCPEPECLTRPQLSCGWLEASTATPLSQLQDSRVEWVLDEPVLEAQLQDKKTATLTLRDFEGRSVVLRDHPIDALEPVPNLGRRFTTKIPAWRIAALQGTKVSLQLELGDRGAVSTMELPLRQITASEPVQIALNPKRPLRGAGWWRPQSEAPPQVVVMENLADAANQPDQVSWYELGLIETSWQPVGASVRLSASPGQLAASATSALTLGADPMPTLVQKVTKSGPRVSLGAYPSALRLTADPNSSLLVLYGEQGATVLLTDSSSPGTPVPVQGASLLLAPRVRAMAAGDLDRDGLPDVLALSAANSGYRADVLRGHASSGRLDRLDLDLELSQRLTDRLASAVGLAELLATQVIDLNGDGTLEWLVLGKSAERDGLALWIATGLSEPAADHVFRVPLPSRSLPTDRAVQALDVRSLDGAGYLLLTLGQLDGGTLKNGALYLCRLKEE